MSIHDDTAAFEAWLRTQCEVVEADLAHKHDKMKENAFVFLRATYYRWARKIRELCPELDGAPAVLAVGDIHSENFGTWRDAEGRLVWGVNDFDEAAVMPYALDLVRLATSVRLADIGIPNHEVAARLVEGYGAGLSEPRPILLDEQETWMRKHVVVSDDKRAEFWREIDDRKKYPNALPPAAVADDLRASLHEGAEVERFASTRKGSGGLGRPRYVAIAGWRGGRIVREAKALVPSAWDWAHGNKHAPIRFSDLATSRFRAPDPFLTVRHQYVVRRIAADARKIDLDKKLVDAGLDGAMLRAMGHDLAALHAATVDARAAIRADLDRRPSDWLHGAAKRAAAAVAEDFQKWKG